MPHLITSSSMADSESGEPHTTTTSSGGVGNGTANAVDAVANAGLTLAVSLEELQCPVCVEPIKDPFVTSCGHTCCYACLQQQLAHRNSCPTCGTYITRETCYPNFLLNKILQRAAAPVSPGTDALLDSARRALSGAAAVRSQELDAVLAALQERRDALQQRERDDDLELLLLFLTHARSAKQAELSQQRSYLACLKADLAQVAGGQTGETPNGLTTHDMVRKAAQVLSPGRRATAFVMGPNGPMPLPAGMKLPQGAQLHVHSLDGSSVRIDPAVLQQQHAQQAAAAAAANGHLSQAALHQQPSQAVASAAAAAVANGHLPAAAQLASRPLSRPSSSSNLQHLAHSAQHATANGKPQRVSSAGNLLAGLPRRGSDKNLQQLDATQMQRRASVQRVSSTGQLRPAPATATALPTTGTTTSNSVPPVTATAAQIHPGSLPYTAALPHPVSTLPVPTPATAPQLLLPSSSALIPGHTAAIPPAVPYAPHHTAPYPAAAMLPYTWGAYPPHAHAWYTSQGLAHSAPQPSTTMPTPAWLRQMHSAHMHAATPPPFAAVGTAQPAAPAAAAAATTMAGGRQQPVDAARTGSGSGGKRGVQGNGSLASGGRTAAPAVAAAGGGGSSAAAADTVAAAHASKKRRMLSLCDELEQAYLQIRRPSATGDSDAAGGASEAATGAPLSAFTSVLSTVTAYSRLAMVAELARPGGASQAQRNNSAAIISGIEFDCEYSLFACAGQQQRISIYDYRAILANPEQPSACAPLCELPARTRLSAVSYSRGLRQHLVSSDFDGRMCLWDTEQRSVVSEYEGHEGRIWSLDHSPHDARTWVSSGKNCVKVWNSQQSSSCAVLDLAQHVCSARYHPTQPHLLALGCASHTACIYDLRHSAQPLSVLQGHRRSVSYVRWLAAQQLVTASVDSTLKLWDTGDLSSTRPASLPLTPECTRTFSGHTNEKNFVGLSVDGDFLACGSETNEVAVYYRHLPHPLATFSFAGLGAVAGRNGANGGSGGNGANARDDSSGGARFVCCVCWRPGSPHLVAASSSGQLWMLALQ